MSDDQWTKAYQSLRLLRYGTDQYAGLMQNIFDILHKENIRPEDIGTSWEEIRELQAQNTQRMRSKVSARNLLADLRLNSTVYVLIDRLYRELKKGDLTLADIDTSEEELERLQATGSRMRIECLLDKVRRDVGNQGEHIAMIRDELDKGLLSPEAAGELEAELCRLTRVLS